MELFLEKELLGEGITVSPQRGEFLSAIKSMLLSAEKSREKNVVPQTDTT